MDRQYSWKRTEEIEIDLVDLLYRLCTRWKQIAVCALAPALILGGIGWLGSRDRPDSAEIRIEETDELSRSEKQSVADAVRLEKDIRNLETYLEHSLLMQIDPYHKARYTMLYRIDHAKMRELAAITESYISFVVNGGAADILTEPGSSWEMDKSYIAELISAYQKTYSYPYQAVIDEQQSGIRSESLFYVDIIARNAREAEKMALELQAAIKECSAEIEEKAGTHRLSLVSSEQSITADSGLLAQQNDKKSVLSSNKTNLIAMTDAFSEIQLAAYQEAAGIDMENEGGQDTSAGVSDETVAETTDSGKSYQTVIKYAVFGFAGGIFIYGCIFVCLYIFRGTVKSAEEMKRIYTFPVYGGIRLSGGNRKNKKSAWMPDRNAYGCTEAQMQKRLGLACQKQGIARLCAVSDFPFERMEKGCLENTAAHLKQCGTDMAVAENAGMDISAWDGMIQAGSVLLVCRTGWTTYRMIDDAMMFCDENGISVAGAMVFNDTE